MNVKVAIKSSQESATASGILYIYIHYTVFIICLPAEPLAQAKPMISIQSTTFSQKKSKEREYSAETPAYKESNIMQPPVVCTLF